MLPAVEIAMGQSGGLTRHEYQIWSLAIENCSHLASSATFRRSFRRTRFRVDAQVEHLGLQIAFGVLRPKPPVEHLGLQIAFGVLRPKPQVEHLGLQIAFGVLRPKPQVEHLGLQIAFGVLRPKPQIWALNTRNEMQIMWKISAIAVATRIHGHAQPC